MKKKIDIEARAVIFSDNEGTEVGRITYEELESAGLAVQSALHGASQKIGDSYAGALKATEDLDDTTPEQWSVSRAQESIATLQKGDWNIRTGDGGSAVTDLAIALAEATGTTVDEAVAKLSSLYEDEAKEAKKALRAHPAIAAILARIRKERADKKAEQLAEKAKGTTVDLGAFGM